MLIHRTASVLLALSLAACAHHSAVSDTAHWAQAPFEFDLIKDETVLIEEVDGIDENNK